jgi:hypothetical protein
LEAFAVTEFSEFFLGRQLCQDVKDFLGTNSIPIFRVCWWFGSTKPDDEVGHLVISFSGTKPSAHPEDGTELVAKKMENLLILMWLFAQEKFISLLRLMKMNKATPHITSLISEIMIGCELFQLVKAVSP